MNMRYDIRRASLDFDDLKVPFVPTFLRFHNEEYGTLICPEDLISYDIAGILGLTQDELNERLVSFYHSESFREMKPLPGAIEGVIAIRYAGINLEILTSRPDYIKHLTEDWLDLHAPGIFDEVHHLGNHIPGAERRSKAQVCLDRNISKHTDDSLHHAYLCAEAGIDTYVFDGKEFCPIGMGYAWNQDKLPENITRVHSWDDIVREYTR